MKCHGFAETSQPSSPAAGEIRFDVALPGEENGLLAIIDEESGKALRLAYDGEIASGSISLAGAAEQKLQWTRARNNGGDFLAFAIGAGGDITALSISAALKTAAGAEFALFTTETRFTYRGRCH